VVGKPLVEAAMRGFNGTLMAYGQTGTGKTHTLTSEDGLIPRLINDTFEQISSDAQHEYKVTCSYIQIYQDKIFDLLATEHVQHSPTKSGAKTENDLALREHPDSGVYIEGLGEFVVRSPKEVFELIQLGRSRLVVRL
jgi:hypothetical protein